MDEDLKKYNHYEAEDFAQDDLFIDWVHQLRPGLDRQWENWLQQHPEKKDTVEQARRLVRMMQFQEKEPSDMQISRIWNSISQQMTVESKTYTVDSGKRFWRQQGWKIAASVILVVGLLYVFNYKRNIKTGYGEQFTYNLPDGSTVNLNAGSLLSYQPFNWKSERVIYLSGEAFFSVKEGEKFVVKTSQGEVEVLGTSFNVYAREEELSVKCFTGKVQVKDRTQQQKAVIQPGEGIIMQAEEKTAFNFKPSEVTDWRQGEFEYEDTPLEKVLLELQRQFNIDLEVNTKLEGRLYTGQFNNKNLEEALQMVLLPMSMDYEYKKAQQLVIIREN